MINRDGIHTHERTNRDGIHTHERTLVWAFPCMTTVVLLHMTQLGECQFTFCEVKSKKTFQRYCPTLDILKGKFHLLDTVIDGTKM